MLIYETILACFIAGVDSQSSFTLC